MPRIFTFRLITAVLICLLPCTSVFSQISYDRILQVNGVIMTSDSLMGISDVTVTVKNQNKGTYSSPLGVFSLVCFKGDTLQFSALGFKDKEVPLSGDINTNTISMVQLMSQDTFFLNETIIHFLPSRENFNYVFQNFQVPDDKYEIARRNSNLATIRMMSLMMNRDGRESQHAVQNDQAYRAAYSGQQTPQNIMNPLKWAEFIDSWKRGDYRKKKNQ